MNGPIQLITALTSYANALLADFEIPHFFPENSSTQFCESIQFNDLLTKDPDHTCIAKTPDDWFKYLSSKKARGIRLIQKTNTNLSTSDIVSAAFAGTGDAFIMEIMLPDQMSEFYVENWEVWNQQAPDKKIWRVTYSLYAREETLPLTMRSASEIAADFRICLRNILEFSTVYTSGFKEEFNHALLALQDPEADVGYCCIKDIVITGYISKDALSLLKAASCAWVFGGMGSWIDRYFGGNVQKEYEEVTARLYYTLNEAIIFATMDVLPQI